jgi:hypothetical protein
MKRVQFRRKRAKGHVRRGGNAGAKGRIPGNACVCEVMDSALRYANSNYRSIGKGRDGTV